ncbi:hypothetical protein RJT34_05886 [Clitoria ternatea]|uniref:Uncharacterized protein n=1 Tax=Clitoria ternatea TaxID=43366 RepID=A0AAN9PSU5_CLITE
MLQISDVVNLVYDDIARELPGVSPACGVCCAPFRYAFYYYVSVAPLRIIALTRRIRRQVLIGFNHEKMLGGVLSKYNFGKVN